jgi:hypothetical protein
MADQKKNDIAGPQRQNHLPQGHGSVCFGDYGKKSDPQKRSCRKADEPAQALMRDRNQRADQPTQPGEEKRQQYSECNSGNILQRASVPYCAEFG